MKAKNKGPKPKPLFVYNNEMELLEVTTTQEFIKKYHVKKRCVENALKIGSIIHSKWYVSRTRDFTIPDKQCQFNPLLSKERKGYAWIDDEITL